MRALLCLTLASTACGEPGGRKQDADAAIDAIDATSDGAVTDGTNADTPADACTMADHPTFWPTICDAADACGWLAGGHPELDYNEAGCLARHASDPEPSALLAYLANMETRVHAAAACLGCQSLVDAYFRPDLETVFCTHIARCGGNEQSCRTQYQTTAMKPGNEAKFDHACPRYCIEQLAADAPCNTVIECLGSCS